LHKRLKFILQSLDIECMLRLELQNLAGALNLLRGQFLLPLFFDLLHIFPHVEDCLLIPRSHLPELASLLLDVLAHACLNRLPALISFAKRLESLLVLSFDLLNHFAL
jgi:hypothetical protein